MNYKNQHQFQPGENRQRMPLLINPSLNPKICHYKVIVEGVDMTDKVHEIDLSKGMLSVYDPNDINPDTKMPFPPQWLKPGQWVFELTFIADGTQKQPFTTKAQAIRDRIIGQIARGRDPRNG